MVLEWLTASETNNALFTLEKSFDAEHYETVAVLHAAGTSAVLQHYKFADSSLNSCNCYYKLTQTDLNGQSETFGPIYHNCKNPKYQSMVFPNPSNGHQVFIQLSHSDEIIKRKCLVEISDAQGNLFTKTQYFIDQKQMLLSILENKGSLRSGMYFIQITTDEQVVIEKLIVE